LKIAAKQLQMEKWLLLTFYRKSTAPCPLVPSPTPYDLPFSHNTSVTDRRTDDNHAIARPLGLLKYARRFGLVGNVVGRINEVNQHQVRLVLGWVTIPVCNQPLRSTQPGHPSVGRRNEFQRSTLLLNIMA